MDVLSTLYAFDTSMTKIGGRGTFSKLPLARLAEGFVEHTIHVLVYGRQQPPLEVQSEQGHAGIGRNRLVTSWTANSIAPKLVNFLIQLRNAFRLLCVLRLTHYYQVVTSIDLVYCFAASEFHAARWILWGFSLGLCF